MEHSVYDSFSIRLAIILKNDLLNTLSKLVQLLTSTYNKSAPFLQYHAANCLFCLVYTSMYARVVHKINK